MSQESGHDDLTLVSDKGLAEVAPRSYGEMLPTFDDTHYYPPVEVLGKEAASDFLWLWLQTADSRYLDLYTGICLADFAELTDLTPDVTADWGSRTQIVLDSIIQRHPLGVQQRDRLEAKLLELHSQLPTKRAALREVRLLFLGDCLFEEVALFLSAMALQYGLLIRPKHIISKNPVEQRRQIHACKADALLAIFYSPFTYNFHTDFAQLLELGSAFASSTRVREMTGHVVQSVQTTVDILADTFECPIFVSNASTILRGTSLGRMVVKATLTARSRSRARNLLNFWLPQHLAVTNQRSFRHLYLLDETAVAPPGPARLQLGKYMHTLAGLHPTRFSCALASPIMERAVAVSLLSRKILVCDLDNTLWEGVIGEGRGVRHYLDRQSILNKLKAKGVVLAVASKNDPTKVVWQGGQLDEKSFVASEVSWEPKVQGIQRIFKQLNIKPKDGVFVDDRHDERAMVSDRWPSMFVADPCDERTWRIFGLWAELLDDEQEFDRTLMYHQREQREVAAPSETDVEVETMFRRLGLKAVLRRADKAALKRASELINRTNQWNLAASRTSFREIEQWSRLSDHSILTVQVDDKLGSMGTVCVAVVREVNDELQVPVFVLSCRVFGFGVETLLLDWVKRRSKSRFGAPKVRGYFTATEHNGPCKDMYREHGYVKDGDTWVYAARGEKKLPTWFEVSGFES